MEEVERYIRGRSNEELIEMVQNDHDEYTETALRIARDELTKREVPETEFEPASEYGCRGSVETEGEPASGPVTLSNDGFLAAFLENELQFPESYEAILDFVASMNIRCGEYEGEKFVIKKMDRDNFIIFAENLAQGGRAITGCVAIGKEEFLRRIEQVGEDRGFGQEEEEQ